jgi:sugar lactone lactonase YvrE
MTGLAVRRPARRSLTGGLVGLVITTLASTPWTAAADAGRPAAAQQTLVVAGFEAPESAYWSPEHESWFVSNYGGAGFDGGQRDGDGFLSRLAPDGTVLDRHWLDGFDAPNGIRGWRGRLLVADVGRLVVIDVHTQAIVRELVVPGALFLNDVAVDPRTGDAYISDTGTDTIWRLRAGSDDQRSRERQLGSGPLEQYLQTSALEGPNGLLVDGSRLVVGTVGPGLDLSTFQTREPGRVLTVHLRTGAIRPYGNTGRIGAIDGIEEDRGGYLVSDVATGRVLRVTATNVTTLLELGQGQAADIGYDAHRRHLGIPALFGTTVTFYHLPLILKVVQR